MAVFTNFIIIKYYVTLDVIFNQYKRLLEILVIICGYINLFKTKKRKKKSKKN